MSGQPWKDGPVISPQRAASGLSATILAAISALHFLWATGSSWPARNPQLISGAPEGKSPGPLACVAVGKLLAVAAALVAGCGQQRQLLRFGRNLVGTVLLVRGAAGIAGKTDLLTPGLGASDEFKQLDRKAFGPLCLLLAVLIFSSRTEKR